MRPQANRAPLILNVDDREGPRYVKSRILHRGEFSVIEAATGQSTLAVVRQHAPALVLLSSRLPDISGLEVCRLIKDDPEIARTLVLLTSPGEPQARQRVEALNCGADGYLVEPAEPEEVLSSIQALLRLRGAEDACYRTTQALHDNEDLFRQLAESLADVVWILDPAARQLLFVSPSFEALWGHPAAEVMEEPRRCLDRLVAADRPRVEAALASMLSDGRMDIEFQMTRPDGQLREIRARAFPVHGAGQAPARADLGNSRPLRIAGICQDVTLQNRAGRALRDEERRKDQFLAMLAHELRNPLAPLRSAADMLQQLSPSREDMFRARDIIGRQLHHLTRLVDELLDISRFNQGRITLRQDLVELRAALNTAVEAVRPEIEAYRHTLRLSLPEQPLPVRGDLVRLTQIFSNLLHNAAAYTPAGGQITVDATLDQDPASGSAGGYVTVRVRDNGTGLSEALQRLLFDPLAPHDPAEDHAGEGSSRGSSNDNGNTNDGMAPSNVFPHDGPGIGLTLVQKLVVLHGGTIRANSPGPGQGSTFTVTLPVEPWHKWHPGTGKSAAHSGVSRRIMVVDDNADALEAMTMTLQTMGHTVVTAPDGPTAVALATAARPEVVLLDLGMPAMDGFETARRLRALPEMRGATLVALTGFGQPEDRRRAMEAGFDQHLVKPADLDALAHLLDTLKERA
ncbi:hybrid sensor histidine kinase/response regulator [Cupriavidus consociatus]|uniref:hybrid sensor histidine kinase/response regulator n=1 Tax=Cupriavidus consociatus TaxID=2821357 RepID=UPI001AE28668|nr:MULTISPECIES: response regulator [unclassified Cupriavidus]MBP0619887.1 response regulator [Cupriavidus sp. LEh25]MDK2656542.1 response regulator [Cupriavidus sp. LEh21]